MELYLMQHGLCLSKDVDPEQPLSKLGREQIETSAAAIKALGLRFQAVVCSPKKRAKETAEIIAQAVKYSPDRIHTTDTVKAMADPFKTFEYLDQFESDASIFIAGHLPSLEALTGLIITRGGKAAVDVRNGGLIKLEVETSAPPSGKLGWYLTPTHLHMLAQTQS